MDDQSADDGLKWFGEGFDGFPKRLPDDCMEYAIYIINQKLDAAALVRSRLNEIAKQAVILRKQYLNDYIWQRDDFNLKVHPRPDLADPTTLRGPSKSPAPPHLRGRTNFGDSVADEWLVVFLLLELSKLFSDAWIRVYDTDGEFLLIEAANTLPKWLNPDVAENRIWINDGHLKIIPLEEDSSSRNLNLQAALSEIRKAPEKLLVNPKIEKEAFHRIREYPSAISSSLHHALVSIPRVLTYILHQNPAYISPAVETFYLRDPISLKPLDTKDIATLKFPPEDFVTVSARFTKVGYAQLRSQIFEPPPAWTAVIPRMHDEKVAMGMKLACGFEMLIADRQNQDKQAVREIQLLLEDVESGDEALPTNEDIATWPMTQDDEKWLDIDYNDFEKELSGRGEKTKAQKDGDTTSTEKSAQANLREMVDRFQGFVNDEETGAEGIDDLDDDDGDDEDESEPADQEEDLLDADEKTEFEKTMTRIRGMPGSVVEESGLLAEARKLAYEDAEDSSDMDEEEQMRQTSELMERVRMDREKRKGKAGDPNGNPTKSDKPFFGPERPPHMQPKEEASGEIGTDEEIGPGDEELSSDDESLNDVDVDLARNVLESFKGQAGMPGPAGNMMKMLGLNMPRDEGE